MNKDILLMLAAWFLILFSLTGFVVGVFHADSMAVERQKRNRSVEKGVDPMSYGLRQSWGRMCRESLAREGYEFDTIFLEAIVNWMAPPPTVIASPNLTAFELSDLIDRIYVPDTDYVQ